MLKRFVCLFALSMVAVCAHAQSGPAPKPDFSKEGYVIERRAAKLVFENDGSGSAETELRLRIQSDAGVKQFGQLAFAFPSSSEKLDIIYVRVRKVDGTVVTTPPGNVLELPVEATREAPMYSDLHQKHVTVKALNVGDTLEVLLRQQTTAPLIPGQFWASYNFDRDEIALDDELQISVPRERALILKSPALKPVVTDEGTRRIYTWKTANLERRRAEEQPRRREGFGPPPDVQLTTFSSWEQVGRWYLDLQKERTAPTAEIRAKAVELTRGAKTDEEKLTALYRYVSTRVRYVALEFGVGRFRPDSAEDVFANEYGDCKDKHTLLAALANAVGISVYPTLINNARDLDPEVPSPAQFDHVITTLVKDSGYVWLDTTAEVAPWALLSPTLRGKSALVITDRRPPALAVVPATPAVANLQSFQAEVKLTPDGVLEGKMSLDTRGDEEVAFRLLFRRVPQAQWKDAVQGLSYNLGYAGEVSEVEAGSPEDIDQGYRFTYHYRRPDYSDWANRRMTPPFPPLGLPEWKDDDKAPGPMLLRPMDVRYLARIELPPGARPEVPKPVHLSTDFAVYDAQYSFWKGVLQCERRLVVKQEDIPASAKADYQKFVKALQDDVSHYIDLGLNSAANATAPELQNLLGQGTAALNKHDYRGAVGYARRAVQLEPRNSFAWAMLAMASASLKDYDEATRALRKAIEVDPSNLKMKLFLAEVYGKAGREAERAHLLSEIASQNREGTRVQFEDVSAADIPTLEAALEKDPSNVLANQSLGNAYLRAGQIDKGITALAKAVELNPAPNILANVVFEMVAHFDRAAQALDLTTRIVNAAEAESAQVDLNSLRTEDLVRVSRLAAYWGVLGWIHLQQRNLPKAESYLNAAWLLAQDPVTGAHLGSLYEKQLKTAAAARIYGMALAGTTGLLPPFSLNDDRDWLQHRLQSLPAGKAAAAADARGQLSRLRANKLPGLKGFGSAEFFLLLTPGPQVEAVRFISGPDNLRAAAAALKSAKLNVSFPAGTTAKLVRRGILACSSLTGCEFLLMDPDSVSLE